MMLGVPGNCLILRVYWSKLRKTSTHVLIMGLAWADLLASAFQIFRIASNCLLLEQAPPAYKNCTDYFLHTAIGTSALITCVIAFDRYDCVCRPHHRLLSRKRAMIAAVCCLATDATVNSPEILEVFHPSGLTSVILLTFQIFTCFSAAVLMVVCYSKVYTTIREHVKVGVASSISGRVRDSSAQQSTQIVSCYTSEANSITLQCKSNCNAPSSAKFAPSAATEEDKGEESNPTPSDKPTSHIREASKAPRGPQAGASLQQPATKLERKTTRMLLISSVVFLISWLPYIVYIILNLSDLQRHGAISPTALLVVHLATYCVYINHAVNPIIYGVANRRFREDCKKELRKLRCW
ncbi:gastrin/cholecystokinin type B receptor-like [Patiria miniata]|uniref:G-protein coupled receptors family 1 profile domain-containing protein n=1 Tax=Patiria miniata TaxID=46514 RepID=A0A913ZQ67_PATMI|nr:gastrin/cholecystokinin type B receptor-like [Patiria miniata]